MLKLLLKRSIYSVIFLALSSSFVSAQIVPDETLGTENSTINSIDELRSRIEGGAIRGDNLFHSFEEFGIPEGFEVYFANPETVTTIFSRITGNNISEIFGTLGVDGTADLFLINPNGIIFGENATVNINGSFIATTAERVDFEDGTSFLSRDRSSQPRLTYNAPIGLGLEETNGSIEVRGNGHNLTLNAFEPVSNFPSTETISIKSQNIALIGNEINFDGAIIEAESGNIFITAANEGNITFNLNNWSFEKINVTQLGNIKLDSRTLVNASGNPGGSIELISNEITLKDASSILIQNRSFNSSEGIKLDSYSLEIDGVIIEDSLIDGRLDFTPTSIITESVSNGKGGNVDIRTTKLSLINGGQIQSTSFGLGNGGDILVEADLVEANASTVDIFSSIRSATFGLGEGGSINIVSKNLSLIDGGSINSTTFGLGKAGDIDSNILDFTNISGFVPDFFTPSSITSVSLGVGDTGRVNLNTSSLTLNNAGTVLSLAASEGNASTVTIYAKNSIQIKNRIFEEPILASAISSSAEVVPSNLPPIFGLPERPSGNAGDLSINTSSLKISDGGIIAVRNTGTGSGGTVEINALEIVLEGAGEISASSSEKEGGNITLNSDRAQLNNGNISASANQDGGNISLNTSDLDITDSTIDAESLTREGGNITLNSDRAVLNNGDITASAGEDGNGGNINIDTNTFLSLGDSDITATAIRGDGGNINITAEGLLGLDEQRAIANNNSSEVDASSQFGRSGVVTIENPQLNTRDPIFTLVQLDIDSTTNLPEYSCERSSITKAIYTGRSDFAKPNLSNEDSYISAPGFVPPSETDDDRDDDVVWKPGDPIVDAKIVRVDENGRVYAVAEVIPPQPIDLFCHSRD